MCIRDRCIHAYLLYFMTGIDGFVLNRNVSIYVHSLDDCVLIMLILNNTNNAVTMQIEL